MSFLLPYIPATLFFEDGDFAFFEPSVTEDQLMEVLGDFITAVINLPVLQGQQNRVPQPSLGNYVIMTPIRRRQMSTNFHEYSPDNGFRNSWRDIEATVQVDFYGRNSANKGEVFANLFRDEYCTRFMAGRGCQPLYCDDGHQMPLIDGEFQYEARWTIHARLQINPAISTPQEFADSLTPTLVEVA